MNIRRYYLLWLRGYSLRTLAAMLGSNKDKVRSIFRAEYGTDATSIRANSLVRSLVKDVTLSDRELWKIYIKHRCLPDNSHYLSTSALQNLTYYQSFPREYMEQIEDDYSVEPEPLRLILLVWLLSRTVDIIGYIVQEIVNGP